MSKQRYVIIRGQVYRWEEKAPFVPSGKSVQGAIEYDREIEALKCHECGEWCGGLSSHVQNAHRDSGGVREYKLRHGLRLKSPLLAPALRQRMQSTRHRPALVPRFKPGHKIGPARPKMAVERTNELGNCEAQTLLELRRIAAELGKAHRGAGPAKAIRSRRAAFRRLE